MCAPLQHSTVQRNCAVLHTALQAAQLHGERENGGWAGATADPEQATPTAQAHKRVAAASTHARSVRMPDTKSTPHTRMHGQRQRSLARAIFGAAVAFPLHEPPTHACCSFIRSARQSISIVSAPIAFRTDRCIQTDRCRLEDARAGKLKKGGSAASGCSIAGLFSHRVPGFVRVRCWCCLLRVGPATTWREHRSVLGRSPTVRVPRSRCMAHGAGTGSVSPRRCSAALPIPAHHSKRAACSTGAGACVMLPSRRCIAPSMPA